MGLRFKKLNNRGIAHHFLVALIAITVVGSIGAYQVFFSKAATSPPRTKVAWLSDKDGCFMAGRVFSNNDCTLAARAGALNKTTRKGSDGIIRTYYANAVQPFNDRTQASCNDLGRRFVGQIGCAKKVNQNDVADYNSMLCIYPGTTYYTAGVDYCAPAACKDKVGVATCPAAPAPVVTPTCPADQKLNTSTNKCECRVAGQVLSGGRCACPSNYKVDTATNKCVPITSGNTAPGPTCITVNDDGTRTGQSMSSGQSCPEGTYSLCLNNAAPVNGSCPNGSTPQPKEPEEECEDGTQPVNGRCANGQEPAPSCDDGYTLVDDTCLSDQGLSDGGDSGYSSDGGSGDDSEGGDSSLAASCPENSTVEQSSQSCICTVNNEAPSGDPASCPAPQGTESAGNDSPTTRVEPGISNKDCTQLYGRKWARITSNGGTTKTTGCSLDTCVKPGLRIIKTKNAKSPYCTGYARQLTKAKCDTLHREWIAKARACAQDPRQTKNGAYTGSIRCEHSDAGKHTKFNTYVIITGKSDKCVKTSTANQIKRLASKFKVPFNSVAKLGPQGFCNTVKKNAYHWDPSTGKCIKDQLAG